LTLLSKSKSERWKVSGCAALFASEGEIRETNVSRNLISCICDDTGVAIAIWLHGATRMRAYTRRITHSQARANRPRAG